MSEIEQQLVKSLKILSEQYEQQFLEVNAAISELSEQIILLSSSTSSAKGTSSQNLDWTSNIERFYGKTACSTCKHALFAIEKIKNSDNKTLNFECLISRLNNPILACSKQEVDISA